MVTDWPTVTVIVGGDTTTASVRRTVASLEHTRYAGDLQILTGDPDEDVSPAHVANNHVGEARGDFILMLPPGALLDPHCVRYLVTRAVADPSIVAVALQWRAPDGTVLEVGSHLHATDEIRPLFHRSDLPEWLRGYSWPTDVISQPSLLVRARDFFLVEGFNLELDGSPYQAAHLVLSLAAGGRTVVETKAVAFAPPATEPRAEDLVRGRNILQADFSHSLDQLHYQSSIDADLSVLLGNQRGRRTLWASTHLPDPTRSGVDARQLQMIQALAAGDDEVVVWASHADAGDSRAVDALGIRWVAQPHTRRWDLRPEEAEYPWLEELVRQLHWDHVVIADPTLVPRLAPLIRSLSPTTAIIADLGSVRFPAAHSLDPDREGGHIAEMTEVDAVVAATPADLDAIQAQLREQDSTLFAALGQSLAARADPAGSLLFVGNLLHRPNAEAVSWWTEAIAGRVEARLGRAERLRVVGNGSGFYRHAWNHPRKLEIAGWQPDLSTELGRARALLVPLPYATGTGGRIATALRAGIPVIASGPAANMLVPEVASRVHVGNTPDELADHVARLMGDDEAWGDAVNALAAWDPAPLRDSQQIAFAQWALGLEPRLAIPA